MNETYFWIVVLIICFCIYKMVKSMGRLQQAVNKQEEKRLK